jgi:Skp family chaperone for outer membrane proteins
MKIQALVTVLALACGSAFAAQYSSGSAEGDAAAMHNQSTAASTDAQPKKGGGLMDKTKNAMHRMGDKMRSVGHRKDKDGQTAAKDDTRSLGAVGSDTQDGTRQRRMDDAYANWQKKQK